MSKVAIKYLIDNEWTMGNGQCGCCEGVPEAWFGHPLHLSPETIGHEANCGAALALVDLGENVLFKGDFESDDRYESYYNKQGIYCTGKVRR